MKTILKTVLVWIMLLAVPLQGFAATTMMLCAPASVSAMPSPLTAMRTAKPHDHQAMLAALASRDGKAATPSLAAATSAVHAATVGAIATFDRTAAAPHAHAATKCGASSACCFGVAMAPSNLPVLPCNAIAFETIPFIAGKTPSVDLAGPERPPQSLLV